MTAATTEPADILIGAFPLALHHGQETEKLDSSICCCFSPSSSLAVVTVLPVHGALIPHRRPLSLSSSLTTTTTTSWKSKSRPHRSIKMFMMTIIVAIISNTTPSARGGTGAVSAWSSSARASLPRLWRSEGTRWPSRTLSARQRGSAVILHHHHRESGSTRVDTTAFFHSVDGVNGVDVPLGGTISKRRKTRRIDVSLSATARGGDNNKNSDNNNNQQESREERLQKFMKQAQKMKVADLKKELQARGIPNSHTFLEKAEFVKAYAEALVDDVNYSNNSPNSNGAGNNSSSDAKTTGSSASSPPPPEEQRFDSSYRDVIMQKMDGRDPRLLQGKIIDIILKK